MSIRGLRGRIRPLMELSGGGGVLPNYLRGLDTNFVLIAFWGHLGCFK